MKPRVAVNNFGVKHYAGEVISSSDVIEGWGLVASVLTRNTKTPLLDTKYHIHQAW